MTSRSREHLVADLRLKSAHIWLGKMIVGWSEPEWRRGLCLEIINWLKKEGFSESEINSIVDPPMILAIVNLMLRENAAC